MTSVKRRLSSVWVPIYHLIALGLAVVTIVNLVREPQDFFPLGFIFMVGFTGIWVLLSYRWKWVELNGDKLSISNYFKWIEVPVSDVHWVEGSPFWGVQPQTAKLLLKESTVFGSEITFIPAGGMYWAEKWAENLRRELSLEK